MNKDYLNYVYSSDCVYSLYKAVFISFGESINQEFYLVKIEIYKKPE